MFSIFTHVMSCPRHSEPGLPIQTNNFLNVNVFNSVASPHVLSYSCVLHYFLTRLVGFNFNLTFGLRPQQHVGGIKTVTV